MGSKMLDDIECVLKDTVMQVRPIVNFGNNLNDALLEDAIKQAFDYATSVRGKTEATIIDHCIRSLGFEGVGRQEEFYKLVKKHLAGGNELIDRVVLFKKENDDAADIKARLNPIRP